MSVYGHLSDVASTMKESAALIAYAGLGAAGKLTGVEIMELKDHLKKTLKIDKKATAAKKDPKLTW